jgi:hypothetical protein
MVRKVALSLFVAVLLTDVPRAVACSCGPPPPMCQRIDAVKVAFVGTPTETNENGDGFIKQGVWYRFRVEQVFKGLPQGTSEVVVDPASGTSCQTGFSLGKQYLVTSYGNTIAGALGDSSAISLVGGTDAGGKSRPAGPIVVVGGCSGSKPIQYAANDIAYLKRYYSNPPTPFIQGLVRADNGGFSWDDDDPPVASVKVELNGPSGKLNATTGKDGNFTVPNVQPGKYTATAYLTGYEATRSSYEIEVPGHGCGVAQIAMTSRAEVSGRVLRSNGTPAKGVAVEAIFANPEYRKLYFRLGKAKSDDSGRFTIYGLPAGDFIVGVHADSPPTADERILPTYWPDATTMSQAAVLHLEPNESRTAVDIKLGEPAPLRDITVKVAWPGGKPAKPAYLHVSAQGHIVESSKNVDDNGTVKYALLAGVEYKFQTRLWTSTRLINGNAIGDKYVDGEGTLSAGSGAAEIVLVLHEPRPLY